MIRRSLLVGTTLTALAALLLTACDGSEAALTPTATAPPGTALDPRCFATEAYALEHLVVVIGEDRVPTAFDAINSGGCSFRIPVTGLTVRLTLEGHRQSTTIKFTAPVTDVVFPLPIALDVPLIDPGLSPGRYERTVTAMTTLEGQEVLLSGFEPVILVREADSLMAELLRAQSRWERNGTPNYRYQARWTCFCPPEYVALVDVSVIEGQVNQVSFADPAFVGEVPDPERFGPVSDLFEFVQDAIAKDAARIDAVYHPELGYPVDVFVDFDELLADEELGFIVQSLSAT